MRQVLDYTDTFKAVIVVIIGFAMATLVKTRWAAILWTFWPTWVWFSVMATGNHFWLDIAAGVLVAAIAALVLERRRLFRRL